MTSVSSWAETLYDPATVKTARLVGMLGALVLYNRCDELSSSPILALAQRTGAGRSMAAHMCFASICLDVKAVHALNHFSQGNLQSCCCGLRMCRFGMVPAGADCIHCYQTFLFAAARWQSKTPGNTKKKQQTAVQMLPRMVCFIHNIIQVSKHHMAVQNQASWREVVM